MEKFGASIEEHIGQSAGTSGPGSSINHVKNQKSWWERRHEKMKELMAEQAKKAVKKAQARRAFERELSLNSYLAGRQRLRNFLSDGTQGSADMMSFQSTAVGALAAMAYENNISIFSESVMGS